MRRLIPYIAFACLTGFTASNGLPLMAGGCSSHMNKTAKIKCSEDDQKCQSDKVQKLNLNETIKSWKNYSI